MTSFLGFQPGEDEFKVMGLAPYGNDTLDLSFFAHPTDNGYLVDNQFISDHSVTPYEPFYSQKLIDKLGPPRRRGEPLNQRHKDIAYATQTALQNCAVSLVNYLHQITGLTNLCMAGGVSLNCTCNNILQKLPYIDNIYIQPSSSDRGLSLVRLYLQLLKIISVFLFQIMYFLGQFILLMRSKIH